MCQGKWGEIYKHICLLKMLTVPLAMQDGRELSLEKGTAIHSSILAWRIPWIEESGGLQSMGLQKAGQDLPAKQHQQPLPNSSFYYIDLYTIPAFKELKI